MSSESTAKPGSGLFDRRSALVLAGGLTAAGCSGTLMTPVRQAARAGTELYVTGSPVPDLAVPSDTRPTGTLTIDGAQLAYWDTGGTGPAIVLLHPATGSSLIWGYQQQALADAGYRVIGYSRRGFNGSPNADPEESGTGAGDLLQLVDQLGVERMHLVGSAAGAFIAASFAIAHPHRVNTLTIACSIVSISDPRVRALVPWLFEPWWNELPHDQRELSASYRSVNKAGSEHWNALHEISHEGVEAVSQPAGDEDATLETMARIPVPTLLLYGGADLLSPPPVGRILASAIPDSELAVLSECGHSAYWERPAEFNATLLDFMTRRGS